MGTWDAAICRHGRWWDHCDACRAASTACSPAKTPSENVPDRWKEGASSAAPEAKKPQDGAGAIDYLQDLGAIGYYGFVAEMDQVVRVPAQRGVRVVLYDPRPELEPHEDIVLVKRKVWDAMWLRLHS